MENIEYGFCECGCGNKTKISKQNHTRYGWIKGGPLRFLRGHDKRNIKNDVLGCNRFLHRTGYIHIKDKENPKSNNGYAREHIAIAEKVLGKTLPPGAVIHHVNEIKTDNWNSNFVICQDNAYHCLLHRRAAAFNESGNANWRKCTICHKYDDPQNLYITPTINGKPSGNARHRACFAEYLRNRRAKKE